jgi:hypothetical protein
MLSMLPVECRHMFDGSLMVINRTEIPAHIDNQILTSINFYVETADAAQGRMLTKWIESNVDLTPWGIIERFNLWFCHTLYIK